MGLTGGADGALVLNRERGRADAYLYVTGRDIEEEKEYALSWDSATATWKIVGEAEEYRHSKERQEIDECLRMLGEPAGPKEVSEALGKPYNNVKQLMWKMDRDGDLRSLGGGKYVPVTDNLDNHDNRDEASTPEERPAPSTRDEVRCHKGGAVAPAVTEVIEVTGIEEITEGEPTPLLCLATTQEQLEPIVYEIQLAEIVGVDLETTGLNPRIDRIRLISIATAEGTWLIDCFEVDPHPLFDVLAHKTLVMHNGAFDLGFLFAVGFEFTEGAEVMDTMLMSQILEVKETT